MSFSSGVHWLLYWYDWRLTTSQFIVDFSFLLRIVWCIRRKISAKKKEEESHSGHWVCTVCVCAFATNEWWRRLLLLFIYFFFSIQPFISFHLSVCTSHASPVKSFLSTSSDYPTQRSQGRDNLQSQKTTLDGWLGESGECNHLLVVVSINKIQ